jgi:hypothetical protein
MQAAIAQAQKEVEAYSSGDKQMPEQQAGDCDGDLEDY